jgi:hypothetical protein
MLTYFFLACVLIQPRLGFYEFTHLTTDESEQILTKKGLALDDIFDPFRRMVTLQDGYRVLGINVVDPWGANIRKFMTYSSDDAPINPGKYVDLKYDGPDHVIS